MGLTRDLGSLVGITGRHPTYLLDPGSNPGGSQIFALLKKILRPGPIRIYFRPVLVIGLQKIKTINTNK